MEPLRRWLLLVGPLLLSVACSPVLAGPELPRPAQSVATVTITPSTTTTTEPGPPPIICPDVFCVKYELKEDAVWSDGTPITAADLAATVEYYREPFTGFEAQGYDLVRDVEVLDSKTALVVFEEPYGPWQNLFERLVPEGTDPGSVIPASGPFAFSEWVRGDRIEVVKSESWWAGTDLRSGQPDGDVVDITFVFMPDVEEMVEALISGDVDVIGTRPTTEMIERLSGTEDVRFSVAPGPFWEHIDFHLDDAMLGRDWARRAIALAIDRDKILENTVRLLDPTASGLDNTVWMTENVWYESHWDGLDHDPAASERLLAENGCARGEDDVQVCGGRRMSFVWTSTNDDPARIATFESVRDDLEVVGIELIPDLRSPSQFVVREHLFGGADVWQMANFSWKDLLDPSATDQRFACVPSDLNVNGYCSEGTEAALTAARSETDPERRAQAYNEVDRLYMEDVAVLPLYQKPTMLAWRSELSGLEPNYSRATDLWNVAAWTGKPSVIVALSGEPTTLDPRATADEAANAVLSTLMYGAFSMAPDQTQVPLLISSAEIIEG